MTKVKPMDGNFFDLFEDERPEEPKHKVFARPPDKKMELSNKPPVLCKQIGKHKISPRTNFDISKAMVRLDQRNSMHSMQQPILLKPNAPRKINQPIISGQKMAEIHSAENVPTFGTNAPRFGKKARAF